MAIVMDEEVVAVGSVFAEDGWRIRGMATAPAHRRRGLASRVLLGLIAEAWGRDRCSVWCNARTSVSGFYAGHAFVAVGPEFELEGIGPHVRMVRSPDVPPAGSSGAT
jgi:predicted GNAT family N-acyltransferase